MNTKQIADKLVAYCRKGNFEEAQKELYAKNARSIEAQESPMFKKETTGLDAIIEKGRTFASSVETLHENLVSDPIVAENSFACTMTLDATIKGRGRVHMAEICVYDVSNGKIVSEQFHP